MSRADFVRLIGADEGCRLKPYRDIKGVLTIGYGRNLEENGIRPSEAAMMRDNDIAEVEAEAAKFPYFAGLSPNRQLVILSLLYNLGATKFRGFKRFGAAMLRFDYETAADEILDSDAARDLPQRYGRLADMMRHG